MRGLVESLKLILDIAPPLQRHKHTFVPYLKLKVSIRRGWVEKMTSPRLELAI